MKKTIAKTLSLVYHPREDRMLLLLNKDTPHPTVFWITRRLYFSILFEFDGYLDSLGIKEEADRDRLQYANATNPPVPDEDREDPESLPKEAAPAMPDKVSSRQAKLDEAVAKAPLLEHFSISLQKERKQFVLHFRSKGSEGVSQMGQKDFIGFYTLMKRSFPKGEWGIV